ncbi:MAG TPA: surface carbohydrate biosynthesis protein [Methylomirabilota bacterium]|nr:surface carbohydrate biosynthesis protein [Methylomirabilota bacterium]
MPPGRAIGPFLYLPIEVASRELHAKLLLAYFAVAAGFEVVIGWKRLLNRNFRYVPPGVVLFKTLTANDGAAMREARAAGHSIASLDEEVPGLVTMQQKLRWVAAESVAASDLIFALGAEHAEALQHFYPEQAGRCHVVGNPRWDLLRPELRGSHDGEVAAIRAQHAPFILVNTNFAALNSSRRTPEETARWFVKTGRVDLRKPEDAVFLDEIFQMERANSAAVRALLRELPARFPGHRVIVRPHPIERAETWSEFLRDIPRTTMIRDGAAVPWIMAADALVHTNCTTGVEAFALDKPAISLQPAALALGDIYLANRINYRTRTVPETLDLLARLVGRAAPEPVYPADYAATFDRFFAGTAGTFASERIVQALRQLPAFGPSVERPQWRPRPGYRQTTRVRQHHRLVMPALDRAALEQVLQGFNRALGTQHRFRVEPCGQLLFHVHGAAQPAAHALPGELESWLRRIWPRRRHAGDDATAAPGR